ncbi:sigma-54-dependent Fis family transcriptional regulator [Chloracidobacterium aggregatum]|uniref:Sigma-54-dependent Fis family transcriptional regulator n=2 Tax=Chloracidobacterium TaxID=458032 RepID=A0ABX8AXD7_9BACT|nr:sigma-54 dependent transcriptional regulator [Chloracidobacterium aggregatum]QUV84783.1 sigma-54-dependent Fis family transcriptional regulator [Chloracidobacterium sp. 2]QUV91732.1 sigma-54-dependent Fis family transcriptional regulator [Chloracidobacterium sp. A]QUV92868.1 sigma-54-dependent Fis family transcriptional regulator [Chloracidobacterium sp. N]QUV96021.1 sigma-54-dependent Fis family transcriptional regulator [Chloracidobacterium sp. E]
MVTGELFIGNSTALLTLLKDAARVAPTEATVVITGESGTGKSLLARWLHEQSRRANGPFVVIDCGSLPEALLEAELFGFERGAFTGAVAAKPGRFEAAQHGTLVLDEIAALSPAAQAKLLRVIEERRVLRLGGSRALTLDVRLVAVTNTDLTAAVARQSFRADLFHRLNVISLAVPALRDRPTDIPALARHFLAQAAHRHGCPPPPLDAEALSFLEGYDFPGNVRELRHAMEHALVTAAPSVIRREHLPQRMTSAAALMQHRMHKPTLAELEATYIREVLQQVGWRKAEAARILGISRKNLYEKLRAYGIPYQPASRMLTNPDTPA